ncbi:hypothetical protein MADE_1014725 [Alteromonas mediterranea DE]|uniref:Uncharacterized protein n=1 Tax=Alteromonas mediterranea (strain DSM 17117 / CIP 110805 / LMG 28347 / Deep ecotype) TaxID=1774373 RepID=F2GCC3_ALTMD|nr:hypothetical protein MADE_1014725 [Alteromonas mediterranea DE]
MIGMYRHWNEIEFVTPDEYSSVNKLLTRIFDLNPETEDSWPSIKVQEGR